MQGKTTGIKVAETCKTAALIDTWRVVKYLHLATALLPGPWTHKQQSHAVWQLLLRAMERLVICWYEECVVLWIIQHVTEWIWQLFVVIPVCPEFLILHRRPHCKGRRTAFCSSSVIYMKVYLQRVKTNQCTFSFIATYSPSVFVHSFSILSDDRSKASSKTMPPHSAI